MRCKHTSFCNVDISHHCGTTNSHKIAFKLIEFEGKMSEN